MRELAFFFNGLLKTTKHQCGGNNKNTTTRMKNKLGRINMKMCDETAAATNTPTTRGKAQMKSEKNLSAENKKKNENNR